MLSTESSAFVSSLPQPLNTSAPIRRKTHSLLLRLSAFLIFVSAPCLCSGDRSPAPSFWLAKSRMHGISLHSFKNSLHGILSVQRIRRHPCDIQRMFRFPVQNLRSGIPFQKQIGIFPEICHDSWNLKLCRRILLSALIKPENNQPFFQDTLTSAPCSERKTVGASGQPIESAGSPSLAS